MIKKAGVILYNIVKILLIYILFHVVLLVALPIAGASRDYTSVILVISFFSLLGTYIHKIEKITAIVFFISICLYFLLR